LIQVKRGGCLLGKVVNPSQDRARRGVPSICVPGCVLLFTSPSALPSDGRCADSGEWPHLVRSAAGGVRNSEGEQSIYLRLGVTDLEEGKRGSMGSGSADGEQWSHRALLKSRGCRHWPN